jgi:hypothetical protein
MLKFISLVIALSAMGGTGFVSAQEARPAARPSAKAARKEARPRIVQLEDRVRNQRHQVRRDLIVDKLTAVQAQACDAFLDSLESQMKEENKANGWKNAMPNDRYEYYEASLDANNAVVDKKKQYGYRYGPYADRATDFTYYGNPHHVQGVPIPSVTAMEAAEPRVFELKDRIHQQRERIDQGLNAKSLTGDEAKGCRDVLASVEGRMKSVFRANHSKTMTREQFAVFAATLDTNSKVIDEEKHYYGHYHDQYTYWD